MTHGPRPSGTGKGDPVGAVATERPVVAKGLVGGREFPSSDLDGSRMPGVDPGILATAERSSAEAAPSLVTIQVSVFDYRSGAPLEGATVTCDGQEVGRTATDGSLDASVSLGTKHSIAADKSGYAPAARLALFDHAIPVALYLVEEAVVFGVVTDGEGHRLPSAKIEARLQTDRDGPALYEGVFFKSKRVTTTDADGAFRLAGLGSSRGQLAITLTASHPDHASRDLVIDKVLNGVQHGPVTVVLPRGGTLVGRIMANEAPAVGKVVLVGGQKRETVSESSGDYRIDSLAPGLWTLTASLAEHPSIAVTTEIEVLANQDTIADIRLDYLEEPLWGRVMMSCGLPLENAELVCEPEGWTSYLQAPYVCRTQADGSFSINVPVQRGSSPSHYRLRLSRWENESTSIVAMPGGERVEMTASDSARVIFDVTDSPGGAVEDVFATWNGDALYGEEDLFLWLATEESGALSVHVPAGTGVLTFGAPGYDSIREELVLRCEDTLVRSGMRLHRSE